MNESLTFIENSDLVTAIDGADAATILISLFLTTAVGIFITAYFRYFVKPKYEIVFDANRKANLTILFNAIDGFDEYFESIYTIFEEKLGLLTKNRKDIVPSISNQINPINPALPLTYQDIMKIQKEYADVKSDLNPMLVKMQKFHRDFLKDYHLFQNYIHDSFLRDVNQYFVHTLDYTKWLLECNHVATTAEKRIKYYNEIKSYLENEKSLIESIPTMKKFLDKWKKYLLVNEYG